MEKSKKTAVIYARVSSVNDRQNTDRQVKDLTAYADGNGYNIAKVFTEHISGAKKNADRPILQECLSYCMEHRIDTLLLSELSRLGRNVWEVQENAKLCIDNSLNVYLQKEGFTLLDADKKPTPTSAIMIAVLGTCAQMERDNISFRLQSGRANYIANGGKLGRSVGYRKPADKKKEEYKDVITMLKKGNAIRFVADKCKVSASTVQRIKKEFSL